MAGAQMHGRSKDSARIAARRELSDDLSTVKRGFPVPLWSYTCLEAHSGNPFRRMAGAQMHGRSTDAWQEHRCMAGARTVRALLS